MTPEDQLARIRTYCQDKPAIAVFENGTVVISPQLSDVTTIMAAYNVAHNGEGWAAGDFQPMPMTDGNTMFAFAPPNFWTEAPEGQAVVVVTKQDLIMLAAAWTPTQGTEMLKHGEAVDPVLLRAGLTLRTRRLQDAIMPKIVLQWEPPAPAVG